MWAIRVTTKASGTVSEARGDGRQRYMIDLMQRYLDDETIVAEIDALGVRLFHKGDEVRSQNVEPVQPAQPALLLASMAASDEVRIGMALVVLFLEQPTMSNQVESAVGLLSPARAEQMRLFYQAAVYLQREIGARGKANLPDLYSGRYGSPKPKFGASVDNTNAALDQLAAANAKLPGEFTALVNWRNTYRKQIDLYLYKAGFATRA